MRLTDDRCKHQTRSDASVHVRIHFCSVVDRCLHISYNTLDDHREHQAKTRQAWQAAHRRPLQTSDQVRCFSARPDNFCSVFDRCLHLSNNTLDDHRQHHAKTRHAWLAARRRPLRESDQAKCFGACLDSLFQSFVIVCMLLNKYRRTPLTPSKNKTHMACSSPTTAATIGTWSDCCSRRW